MTYLSDILTDAPTSVWMFDEASGTSAADSSGNGHTATYNAISAYQVAGPSSAIPYGVLLAPASSSHVQVPAAGIVVDGTNGVTLEGWVYVISHSDWARLFDFGNGSGTNNLLIVPRDNTGKTASYVFNGSSAGADASSAISTGAWHHLAVTITATGAQTLYIDGVQAATGSGQNPATSVRNNAYIGRSDWSTDPYLNGKVAAVALYPKVLTATRVLAHYNSGISGGGGGGTTTPRPRPTVLSQAVARSVM